MPDRYQLLAFLSTGAYFAGLALFKSAASSMPTLEGSRPRHLTRTLLTSKRWIAGSAVIGTGAAAQVMALTGLRLLEALPMFLAGLASFSSWPSSSWANGSPRANGAARPCSPPRPSCSCAFPRGAAPRETSARRRRWSWPSPSPRCWCRASCSWRATGPAGAPTPGR